MAASRQSAGSNGNFFPGWLAHDYVVQFLWFWESWKWNVVDLEFSWESHRLVWDWSHFIKHSSYAQDQMTCYWGCQIGCISKPEIFKAEPGHKVGLGDVTKLPASEKRGRLVLMQGPVIKRGNPIVSKSSGGPQNGLRLSCSLIWNTKHWRTRIISGTLDLVTLSPSVIDGIDIGNEWQQLVVEAQCGLIGWGLWLCPSITFLPKSP